MQNNTNNIQKMVANAVRDAVAPLYAQMREIEEKYYPDMNKQEPQQPEDEAQAFDVSRFENIYDKSGRIPKNTKSGADIY
jgi:hypothetical protein